VVVFPTGTRPGSAGVVGTVPCIVLIGCGRLIDAVAPGPETGVAGVVVAVAAGAPPPNTPAKDCMSCAAAAGFAASC
jgi:hypothetical protein